MTVSHPPLSDRDLELLSAYLDGALSDREQETVEQRLARDAALRATLDDLRETVALLRDLPPLQAPRNFTLDPAVYGRPIPRWRRLFAFETVLQFSGALGAAASIALVIAVVFFSQGAEKPSAERPEGDADQASSEIAMQATSTMQAWNVSGTYRLTAESETTTGYSDTTHLTLESETAIAYSGDGLLQATIITQMTAFPAPPSPTMTLAPTPTLEPYFEAEAAAQLPSEAPAQPMISAGPAESVEGPAPGFNEPPALGGAMDSAAAPETGQTMAQAAPEEAPSSTPSPTQTPTQLPTTAAVAGTADDSMRDEEGREATGEPATVQPAMAPSAGGGESDFQSDEQGAGFDQPPASQPGDTVTNTLAATPVGATPTPAQVAAAPSAPETIAGQRAEKKERESRNLGWLAGVGVITLAISLAVFIAGYRKAHRL